MNLWTVVLKAMASRNGNGEWPYMVRAFDEEGAIARAFEAHKLRHPTKTPRYVIEIVRWEPHGA